MIIQAPTTLATLPQPLSGTEGKLYLGEVQSLADLKKRKRYEVVAAVDGESVNIYNVSTEEVAHLVTYR